MKYLLALVLFCAGNLSAQSLKKYPISNSGCSAYFFCNPDKFDMSKSPDSSEVYTGECSDGGITYGIICAKLKDKTDDLNVGESMLIAYLDFVKGIFSVTSAAGYGKGHRLHGNENTRGIIDYWKDKDANNIQVKGWTNGKYVTVMYVSSTKELPTQKVNVFLDGLVFP